MVEEQQLMKLSYTLSVQNTSCNFISRGGWTDKVFYLSGLGYDGVELSIRDPKMVKAGLIENILNKSKLELSAIGTGQMFADDGLSLCSLEKSRRKRAIERIKEHINMASLFNSQVIIGLARGRKKRPQDPEEKYSKNLIQSFQAVCTYADKKKVNIVIEPINRYETGFLNCAHEALDFIRGFKCKYLKILLDTFHMNIEEKNFAHPILESRKYLAHMHLADSNRRVVGSGHIDFKEVIGCLKICGYQGYLSAEIIPVPDFKTCARDYRNNMRRLL